MSDGVDDKVLIGLAGKLRNKLNECVGRLDVDYNGAVNVSISVAATLLADTIDSVVTFSLGEESDDEGETVSRWVAEVTVELIERERERRERLQVQRN